MVWSIPKVPDSTLANPNSGTELPPNPTHPSLLMGSEAAPRVLGAVPRVLGVVPRVLGAVPRVLGVIPRVLCPLHWGTHRPADPVPPPCRQHTLLLLQTGGCGFVVGQQRICPHGPLECKTALRLRVDLVKGFQGVLAWVRG